MRTALRLVVLVTLAFPATAVAGVINVDPISQQLSPGTAAIGAGISTTGSTGSAPGSAPNDASGPIGTASGGGNGPSPPVITVSPSSSLLNNPTPAGPGSFWMSGPGGQRCIYAPGGVAPCVNVAPASPAGGPALPPVNPAALAASAANQLQLGPGRIEASPSAQVDGLTGVASWFWLSQQSDAASVSVSLRGEHVIVTATARQIRWSFGDGSSLAGGPGVPYRPGAAPPGAVVHEYQTRCLPGDQGRDPYVLASCGPDGYTVSASVGWSIGFTATGPVSASGSLPSRTTSTSISYPVSEARAFLTAGGAS